MKTPRGRWIVPAAVLLTASAIAGCRSGGESADAGTINNTCPIGGHEVNPSIVREWKGQKIGFCCEDCVEHFDTLAAAGKDDILKKAGG